MVVWLYMFQNVCVIYLESDRNISMLTFNASNNLWFVEFRRVSGDCLEYKKQLLAVTSVYVWSPKKRTWMDWSSMDISLDGQ